MQARFDDPVLGRAVVCGEPSSVLVAWTPEEVGPALEALDRATASGAWAYGFLAYEAARAFGLATREPLEGLPLLWFGLCDEPADAPPVSTGPGLARPWSIDWTEADHAARVAVVRDRIARGDTYQVNLTTRLRCAVDDPDALYADLVAATGGAYAGMIDTGRWVVCCGSPELLVEVDGDRVLARPMKGTARRGLDGADDARIEAALRGSAKERAENVMIVDLVRNDLSSVADDVHATVVGRTERYPAVWQLTSDVVGRLRTPSLAALLAAVFPCGSVTGAPKASTMAILAGLEDEGRGVYCGAVGLVGPGVARLAVPIRTALVDRASGTAVYGAGGGITWSSDAAAEWRELLAKAPAVEPTRRLLETMRYVPGSGVRHGDRHLRRLARSAAFLGFPCDTGDLARRLTAVDEPGERRVRLLLAADGTATIACAPVGPETATVVLEVDAEPVDAADRWLRHKNDRREEYDRRRDRHPAADDVVLVNGRGRATETTRANLLVLLGGRWVTPPEADGLLPGIGREVLLEGGEVTERSVTVDELRAAEAVHVVSSLRGRREAVLV